MEPARDLTGYGIDRTLIVERLRLTPAERLEEHVRFMEFVEDLQKQVKANDKFSGSSGHPLRKPG